MPKTINNIPVSDDDFMRMALLQERMRRIEAEAKLLAIEKSQTEQEIKDFLAIIESPPKESAVEARPAKAD